jgi:hypothetical protein
MRTRKARAEDMVTITLDMKDAEDIRATCFRTGGNPSGPRGAFDRLDAALFKAGVRLHEKLVVNEGPGIFLAYNTYLGHIQGGE